MKQFLLSAMLTAGVFGAQAQTAQTGSINQSTSGCISNVSQAFMPTEVIDIVATTTETNGIVSWGTTTGHRVANFVVERSLDGKSFTALQSVAAKGSGDYSFTDVGVWNIATGKVWYRLQIVGTDGSSSYSSAVELAGKP